VISVKILIRLRICHQDSKTQRGVLTKGFALYLGAFVAIFSGLAGLNYIILQSSILNSGSCGLAFYKPF
jgi:hypothetical protein